MSAGNEVTDVYGTDVERLTALRAAETALKKTLAGLSNPVQGVMKARISLRKASADPDQAGRAELLEKTLTKKQAELDALVAELETLKASFPAAGEPDSTEPSKAEIIAGVLNALEPGKLKSKKDFMEFTSTVRTFTQILFKEMGILLTTIKELKRAQASNDDDEA
ncbi:uncharacterized protein AMSG_00169 [Thecamonas trahens ATCC 50062]|uniref:Uncharacterized protein n=1 Tax=Thecamonas trahens ATCC 50062 TaxID=461836 RepID=A0A0L0D1E8_THETB|nr:hypothetical protein AMSG_00169 [Thecamonas trahens ATCC 50062]KNC46051.1 hypothetical protein AMSG_00169 [Thecamonas trahens ATCC 50062]|eukprot:XP_013763031.1 hypothetical protein AMSG_00169 [Thecamonas trahens ATCC 50062]